MLRPARSTAVVPTGSPGRVAADPDPAAGAVTTSEPARARGGASFDRHATLAAMITRSPSLCMPEMVRVACQRRRQSFHTVRPPCASSAGARRRAPYQLGAYEALCSTWLPM
jgi:hypothetical protein